MLAQDKPRFHDEECFGSSPIGGDQNPLQATNGAADMSSSERLNAARNHFLDDNIEAAVDELVSAYEEIARDRATLAALRNKMLKSLSTSPGWQSAPHPQALRLRRSTPSIPLNRKERLI